MDNDDARGLKNTYRSTRHCGYCGKTLSEEYIRCPMDGNSYHAECCRPCKNEEYGIVRMLCIRHYDEKIKEMERKRREEKIKMAKIIFALVIMITLFLLVKRWL